MVATLTGVLQIFKKTRESKLLDSLVFLNICIGHKTKRAKWVMVWWDERLLVSEG